MSKISKAYEIFQTMTRYNISILGISEARYNGRDKITLSDGTRLLYPENKNQ